MAALILFNYLLQSTVLQSIQILGVTPDTAVILIVGYGIMRNDVEGAVFGFFAGLAHDLFGGYFIGLYAMLGMLTGYVCGKPFRDFFHNIYFLSFFMVAAATLVYQLLFYIASFMFLGHLELGHYFQTIIFPKTIYTAVLAIPVYFILYAVNSRLERYERSGRGFFKKG